MKPMTYIQKEFDTMNASYVMLLRLNIIAKNRTILINTTIYICKSDN